MNRETEIRLIKEALAFKVKGETQYHDETRTHPTQRYTHQSWFQREQEKLFFDMPFPLGTASEVPQVGDYVSIEGPSGLPLLMVRDADDQVRVFANACRHRGARIVEPGSTGCKKKFICPYHAWTYDTAGKLAGAPDFERGFVGLDKQQLGLREFDCQNIGGVVFVQLDPDKSLPEENWFPDEMISGFEYLNLEEQRVYKRRRYPIKANWKILLEGGIEAYHFNVAHKQTLAPFFLGNLSTWESWKGFYMRMILPKKPLLQAQGQDEAEWSLRQMANIIFSLSPSMMILAQPDNISLIKTIPVSPQETLIEEVLLVDPPKSGEREWSPAELDMHETNHNLVHKILMEDWVIGEAIQANMQSGLVEQTHFGRFESALTAFHEAYEDKMQCDDSLISMVQG